MKVKANPQVAPTPVTPSAATVTSAAPANGGEKPPRRSRQDFAAGAAGWAGWCQYNEAKARYAGKKCIERADVWARRAAGEEVGKTERKLKRIEKLTAMIEALKAEIQSGKAPAAKA